MANAKSYLWLPVAFCSIFRATIQVLQYFSQSSHAPNLNMPRAKKHLSMASWVLRCKNCLLRFEHFKIPDTLANFFYAEKPEFPWDGKEIECPACGKKAIYHPHELIYQSRFEGH